jgi:hypothetical protein
MPSLADLFGVDLFAPKADQNNYRYGARAKKNIKVGSSSAKPYTPNGLTPAEHDKIRKAEFAKKQENYQEKEKKAFKFIAFTEWYAKRGTDLDKGNWLADINKGHTMVKTKYPGTIGPARRTRPRSFNLSRRPPFLDSPRRPAPPRKVRVISSFFHSLT